MRIPYPSARVIPDVQKRLQLPEEVSEAVLSSPGITRPDQRRAIASLAGRLSEHSKHDFDAIPVPVARYVEKVALNAYRITDGDVELLRDAGYSEDAIFEITLCAALGASLARLERGLTALREAGDAPEAS